MACIWLSIVLTWVVSVNASPIPFRITAQTASSKGATDTRTVSPALLALPESLDFVSLMPEKVQRSETNLRATASTDSETPVNFSGAGRTAQHAGTSSVHTYSRKIRSVTSQENQVTEETPVVLITEQTTASPVNEETTVFLTAEATTASETLETTTVAADLDPQALENASRIVRLVLSRVWNEMNSLTDLSDYIFDIDYQSRPMLPKDIVENAKQCLQIQPMLKSIHEVTQDFISYLEGLKTLTGNTTVKRTLQSLDRQILKLILPIYEYTPTAAPGTDKKNKGEVITTLITLESQIWKIEEVIIHLKSC